MGDWGIKSLGIEGPSHTSSGLTHLQNFIFYHMQTQSPTQTKSCTVPTVLSRGAQNEWTWQMRTAVLLLSKAPILGSTHQMLSLVILPTKPFSLGDAIQYTCKVPSFVSRFYIMILYYELGIDILLCSGKCVTCLFYSWEDSRGTFACSRTWGGQEPQVFTQHKTFIQIVPGLYRALSWTWAPREILFSCLCTILLINLTDFTLSMLAKNTHM